MDTHPRITCVWLFFIGEITEKKAADISYSLNAWKETKRAVTFDKFSEEKPPENVYEVIDPVEMLISTPGGSSCEMFRNL